MNKHITSILIALLACCTAVAQSYSGGDGSAANPFLISSRENMEELATAVNGGTSYSGKYFLLTRDLTIEDDTIRTVIGNSESTAFRGTFDGGGHEVAVNINFTSATSNYVGVFGSIRDATIKRLGVSGSVSADDGHHVGGICGNAVNSSISDCYNTSNISSYNGGGICGVASAGSISNCYNTGSVSSINYSGGICGNNIAATSISYCFNAGSVSSMNGSGGICGQSYSVSNCYNIGSIFSTSWYSGGISGYSRGKILNCINSGSVFGAASSGGICGFSIDSIYNCCNTGNVSDSNVGGICGAGGAISHCYNTGDVGNETTARSGGIVAYGGDISNCYNTGSIFSAFSSGGICGEDSDSRLSNCYNSSIVRILSDPNYYRYAGGIIGNHRRDFSVLDCFVANDSVSTTGTGGMRMRLGRVAGNVDAGTGGIQNCYSLSSMLVDGATISSTDPTSKHGADAAFADFQSQTWIESKMPSWDFTDVWEMPATTDGETRGLPIFKNQIHFDGFSSLQSQSFVADTLLWDFDNVWTMSDKGSVYQGLPIFKNENTTYRIIADAETGGSIAPKDTVVVAIFNNQTFKITPNRGYEIDTVWIDGNDSTAIVAANGDSTYTFTNVITNHTISATFKLITYTITYELNGGTNPASNPDHYTIESAEINLQNPTKVGYTFIGWSEGTGIIPAGSTGNKTFTAQWTIVEYDITYELNGGTNPASNPDHYTIESAEINLQAPNKAGHTFTGWSEGTTIPAGSTGNKTFTAQWTIVEYDITYELNGGTNHASNPAHYTIESAEINLQNPTKTGYFFAGWAEGNGIIPAGSTGNKTFTATWAENIVIVTPDELSKIYGEPDPAPLTYGTDNSDAIFTGALERETGENVGQYAITQGSLSAVNDYAITFISGKVFTINRKSVTITGISAFDKIYDGNAVAAISGLAVVSGIVAGDDVRVGYGSAAFADAETGTDKLVTFSGFTLSGADAGNYILSAQPANVTADIIEDPAQPEPPIDPPVEPKPPIEPPVEPEPPIEPPVEPEPPIEPPVEPEPPIIPPAEIVDSIWIYVSNSTQAVAGFYVAECGADKAVVTIVTGNPSAKVAFTYGGMIVEKASITIDIRRAGIYTVNYSVDEVPYSLKIESRLRFEDVITMRYNNVLIVRTNSGNKFVSCEWFHNTDHGWEKVKPDGVFYSVGGARSDILDTIYEYKATLHTDDGRTLHTCPRRIILIYPPAAALSSPAPTVKAYPNPVSGGTSITIEGIPEAVNSIAVHDFVGRLLSKHPLQAEHAPLQQIPMPSGRGIYFVKVGEVTLKVLVE